MSLGSSIGNFPPDEAAKFLADFAHVLSPADFVLIGLDACQNPPRVFKAYNDSKQVTEHFYRNGLDHVNRLLGSQAFEQKDWHVEGEYDEQLHRHHASYVALRTVQHDDFLVRAGEKIDLESAFKYSKDQSDQLWHSADLIPQMAFGNTGGDYCRYCSILEHPLC
jgi:L-histidine Nalpha-methyltransferase / hercynylcysteine S-oxide synthase